MNKFKKIGMTALAASLVSVSAHAGALSVSGSASMTAEGYSGENLNAGTGFSMGNQITFSGSGEMDNGMTISYHQLISAGAFSSSGLKLDMGDAGVLSFANGTSQGHGIGAYEDKMPTAAEQVWDDMDGQANGVLTKNGVNKIGYGTSFAGANVSVDYNKQQDGGSAKSIAVDMSPVDGAMIFVAQSDEYAGTNATTDQVTFGGTYTTGGVTAGVQMTSIDFSTANADTDRTHIAASFAVNEDLSVSWGMSTVSFEDGSKSDQEDSGFSVSYTMGSITIAGAMNQVDSAGGTTAKDAEATAINISFAF